MREINFDLHYYHPERGREKGQQFRSYTVCFDLDKYEYLDKLAELILNNEVSRSCSWPLFSIYIEAKKYYMNNKNSFDDIPNRNEASTIHYFETNYPQELITLLKEWYALDFTVKCEKYPSVIAKEVVFIEKTNAETILAIYGGKGELYIPPAKKLEETPEKTLEETPEKTLEETPEKTLEETPEKTLEETPEKTLEETPEKTLEETPEKTLEETPEKKLEEAEVEKITGLELNCGHQGACGCPQ